MFKVGDKVRAVKPPENRHNLLIHGKIYEIKALNGDSAVYVIAEDGLISSFWNTRFELVESKPNLNSTPNSISDKVKELEDKKTELEACIKALLEEIETTSNNMSKLVEQIKGKLNE